MANKRIFVSFPEQDENLRDLLVGQSKNTNSPFDFTDMSVHKPWDNAWKTKCRIKIKDREIAGIVIVYLANDLPKIPRFLMNRIRQI